MPSSTAVATHRLLHVEHVMGTAVTLDVRDRAGVDELRPPLLTVAHG